MSKWKIGDEARDGIPPEQREDEKQECSHCGKDLSGEGIFHSCSPKEQEELPTAAIVSTHGTKTTGDANIEFGDELVRRSDVEELLAQAVPTDEELADSPYCDCEADRASDGTIIDVEVCGFHSGMMEMQNRLLESVEKKNAEGDASQ